ncbi:XRE family transcriptional regulator [Vibrio parahaemolyticus]|uniref:HigA2-like helix-turn-helix domain-containing protein n=1 Tax=Vibrio jasicida TaxID=766224 RepID=A0AAU9QUZ4_9VIBR|nr:XRE family transcriptional regulator [Vibrio parahaemolyticus]EJE4724398.1 XRE family transcriptional regulator [Vibrio parahaemolyticus]EJG0009692.1 XRE family transcriptional regulator [Vibrio parahaemolyticus]CAH1598215.1 hypothetical protein THF1C08_50034 [Vibrio jasicida]CAH1601900.1 hypothetical protein THF1A12_50314 [Vibrio jasicida]
MTKKTETPDGGSLSFRLILASRVKKEILERNWGQVEAAKNLETSQSRISYVMNLKVEELAEKSLLKMLILLGHEIDSELVEEHGEEFIRVEIHKPTK